MTRSDIENLGFAIVATTTFEDGVSYDAHRVVGKRVMVRGDKRSNEEEAYSSLYERCLTKML